MAACISRLLSCVFVEHDFAVGVGVDWRAQLSGNSVALPNDLEIL